MTIRLKLQMGAAQQRAISWRRLTRSAQQATLNTPITAEEVKDGLARLHNGRAARLPGLLF